MPVLSARLCAYLSEELRMRPEKSDECRLGDADARKCGFGSAGCALRGIVRDTPCCPYSCTNAFFNPHKRKGMPLGIFSVFHQDCGAVSSDSDRDSDVRTRRNQLCPLTSGRDIRSVLICDVRAVHRSDEDPPRSL